LAIELADRLLDPIDPLREGSAAVIAADLCQQALYWALLAQTPELGRPSPAELIARSDAALRVAAGAAQDPDLEPMPRLDSGFVELAELSEQALRVRAALGRDVTKQLLAAFDPPRSARVKLWLRRAPALVVVLGLLGVAIAASAGAFAGKPPNLAQGKPWQVSSKLYDCKPDLGKCGDVPTKILFHTRDEQGPWFEYDLGAPTAFSSMTIRNRRDYGADRAVPLVVEVSNDRQSYREIARRRDTFNVWRLEVAKQRARYVRLRVPRKTLLHLEAVQIHP
jgi:hypothetical protein